VVNQNLISTIHTKEIGNGSTCRMVSRRESRTGKELHLDALNGYVSAYMKEPYTVITKHDTEDRRYIKRFHLKPFNSVLGMELAEFLSPVGPRSNSVANGLARR
jgi:hypothetical protein